MNAVFDSALKTYARLDVETGVAGATPEMLIVMLYDGAIRAVSTAVVEMQRGEIAAKGAQITKALRILEEGLSCALDTQAGGELAENLAALYEYMGDRLMLANLRNDPALLEEVRLLLSELREAWQALVKKQSEAGEITASPRDRGNPMSYGKV